MRVLFDHNVPRKLRHLIGQHIVETADAMGWAELKNGDLLSAAESGGFDVMVTGDKNLSHQQNLKGRRLAIVVLGTNDWNVLKVDPTAVAEALQRATPGSFQFVRLR